MQTHYKRALYKSAFHSWRALRAANDKRRSRRQWVEFALRRRLATQAFKLWHDKARRRWRIKHVFEIATAAWDCAESDYPVYAARLSAAFGSWLGWTRAMQVQRKESRLSVQARLHRQWFLRRSSFRHWALQVCMPCRWHWSLSFK